MDEDMVKKVADGLMAVAYEEVMERLGLKAKDGDVPYKMIVTDSTCSICEERMTLLCAKNPVSAPSFYICFPCHRVRQANVGTVDVAEVRPTEF